MDDEDSEELFQSKDTLDLALGALYYLELWFRSFGGQPMEWPTLKQQPAPAFLAESANVPHSTWGDALAEITEMADEWFRRDDFSKPGAWASNVVKPEALSSRGNISLLLDAHITSVAAGPARHEDILFDTSVRGYNHTLGLLLGPFVGGRDDDVACPSYRDYQGMMKEHSSGRKGIEELSARASFNAVRSGRLEPCLASIWILEICQQLSLDSGDFDPKSICDLYFSKWKMWAPSEFEDYNQLTPCVNAVMWMAQVDSRFETHAHGLYGKVKLPSHSNADEGYLQAELAMRREPAQLDPLPAFVSRLVKEAFAPSTSQWGDAAPPGHEVQQSQDLHSSGSVSAVEAPEQSSRSGGPAPLLRVEHVSAKDEVWQGSESKLQLSRELSGASCMRSEGWLLDARQILSLNEQVSGNCSVSFNTYDILDGDSCFLIAHHASTVSRSMVGRAAQLAAQATQGEPRLTYVSVQASYTGDTLMSAENEILACFNSHREAWLFLDENLGDKSLVICKNDGLLLRSTTGFQRWSPAAMTADPLEHFPALLAALQKHAKKAVPEGLHALLAHFTPQGLDTESDEADVAANRSATFLLAQLNTLLEHQSISHEDFFTSATESNVQPEDATKMWSAIRGALGYEAWLKVLAEGPGQNLRALVKGLFSRGGRLPQRDANGGHVDLIHSDASGTTFCDLFRLRRDLQTESKRLPELTVAISFASSLLDACPAQAQADNGAPASESDSQMSAMKTWLLDVLSAPLLRKSKFLFLSLVKQGPYGLKRDNVDTSLQDIVIMVTLSHCCPMAAMREQLIRALDLLQHGSQNLGLRELLERRDQRYGIVITPPRLDLMLKQDILRRAVRPLDAARFLGRDQALFLSIVALFDTNCHIVYVQHMKTASDLFLKWCCEYTRRWPWRFIYFQDLQIATNFPEIRDRCRFLDSDLALPPARQLWLRPNEQVTLLCEQPRGEQPRGEQPRGEQPSADRWEDTVLSIMQKERSVLLLTSSPGVGKTFLAAQVRRDLEERNILVVNFDCSDDRLVELGLTDLLDREFFAAASSEACLIADEFHLLTPRHKRELFAWVKPRMDHLRVLLIGNRVLRVDEVELAGLRRDAGNVGSHVKSLSVKRTPKDLGDICVGEKRIAKEHVADLELWYGAIFFLLGPSALSLRDAFHICESPGFNPGAVVKEYGPKLADSLRRQAPLLSEAFCKALASAFLEARTWDDDGERQEQPRFLEKSSLLDRLCCAAMELGHKARQSPRMLDEVQPFAIYFATGEPQRWKPEDRVKHWLRLIWPTLSPSDVDMQAIESNVAGVKIWLDQDPFPYIDDGRKMGGVTPAPAGFHYAASIGMSVTSLERLQYCVVHSIPVDWSLIEDQWSQRAPTDRRGFEELLKDSPNKLLPLEALCGRLGGATSLAQSDTFCASFCTLAERSAAADASLGLGSIAAHTCEAYRIDKLLSARLPERLNATCIYYTLWRHVLVAAKRFKREEKLPDDESPSSTLLAAVARYFEEQPEREALQLLHGMFSWVGQHGAPYATLHCASGDRVSSDDLRNIESALASLLNDVCHFAVRQHLSHGSSTAFAEIFAGPPARLLPFLVENVDLWTLFGIAQATAAAGNAGMRGHFGVARELAARLPEGPDPSVIGRLANHGDFRAFLNRFLIEDFAQSAMELEGMSPSEAKFASEICDCIDAVVMKGRESQLEVKENLRKLRDTARDGAGH